MKQSKIALVAARFNGAIVASLTSGAKEALLKRGVPENEIEIFEVPGALELPLVCQRLAKTRRFAGILALGVVIRGETTHYDYVCNGCVQGIMQAQLITEVPILSAVLTTEDEAQALARAGGEHGNKGEDCAIALLEMITVLGQINEQ